MSDERLNDLEIKFSYQEELLNELNKIVANQQMIIDKLVKEVKKLHDQNEGDKSVQEKPPHY